MRHRRRDNLPEQAIHLRQRRLSRQKHDTLHNERSKGIIARILEKGDTNAYTIEKKGIRKMIYQTAWRREDGTVGGIIELSMPIPAEMPHYVRG